MDFGGFFTGGQSENLDPLGRETQQSRSPFDQIGQFPDPSQPQAQPQDWASRYFDFLAARDAQDQAYKKEQRFNDAGQAIDMGLNRLGHAGDQNTTYQGFGSPWGGQLQQAQNPGIAALLQILGNVGR